MNLQLLASAILQRFPDSVLERRYRHEQRFRQGKFVRALAWIAVTLTVVSWAISFAQAGNRATMVVVSIQMLYVPILLIYAWFIGRPTYADAWWADVALFVVIQPIMVQTVVLVPWPGWPFHSQMVVGLMSAMAFASITFAAAFRAYAAMALASIAMVHVILILRGLDREIASFTIFSYGGFALLLIYINWAIDDKARSLFAARVSLDAERQKSETLLANILPQPVAERLKAQEAVADGFADIVVVFIDLVGFTMLSQQLGAGRLVELLNAFFERADHGTDLFGLEKVKTIGDAYMAVAGALTRPPRPAKAAIDFAVWLRREAREVGRSNEIDLRLHVGIASGPAIGGVTGNKRLSYDYWGHTVNLAARLQDSVGADGIAVSELVRRAVGDSYPFREPRSMMLKGVGTTLVFDVDLPA